MKTTIISTQNKPAIYSFVFIAFAIFFWIAVILEQFFNSNWLVEKIVLKIDSASSILSVLLCLAFPIIALIINLIQVLKFNFKNERNEWIAELRFQPTIANTAIIIFCLMNSLMLTAYLFTESFILLAI